MAGLDRRESLETILTFDNRDTMSQWSVVWSTTHITDMENSALRSARMRKLGRRRLRIGSLAISALLTMHCRLTAAALTGQFFFFMVFLIAAVAALANPVRHFEVYLGQWSISGPGRAFRMVPMLDGIGIAMCINAIVRAISFCTMAAIAGIYVSHTVSDAELPFKYCRDFNLQPYTPERQEIKALRQELSSINETEPELVTFGMVLKGKAWRNASFNRRYLNRRPRQFQFLSKVKVCKETYTGTYPPMFTTPAYNFFYVELTKFRKSDNLGEFNLTLVVAIVVVWFILWITMILEKISYGRILYNNLKRWIVLVPWIWCILLIVQAASNLSMSQILRRVFRLSNRKETVAALADAFEIALYIHSLGIGSELIYGKAMHYYASGHIDPNLNGENLWHSGILLMLAGLHSGGAAMCAVIDYKHFNIKVTSDKMRESSLWIMPMYSKCTSIGQYSHLVTTLIFGGLTFSYMAVSYFLLKTALHTIFEYRVKLVDLKDLECVTEELKTFLKIKRSERIKEHIIRQRNHWEQLVVAGLILACMGLNMIYAMNGGIELLESVDALMTSLAVMFVIFLELICLLFVYRSHDFQSDMRVATEDNMCSSRIGIQWQIVPFLTLTALGMKISVLPDAEMSSKYMSWATIPLAAVVFVVPLRAAVNALFFVRHKGRTN